MILGIDEVGRGPWAGPLVVGAVILGGTEIVGLTDSKKLTKLQRQRMNDEVISKAAAIGLGWVSPIEIDELGLSASLRLATIRAVKEIKEPYHEIVIDGTVNFLDETGKGRFVTTMKKADLLIPSVSAASIVAKVARDKYMEEQDLLYPGYGFGSHVGYGTAKHRQAIEDLGVTPLHRLSFAPLAKYDNRRLAGKDEATATHSISTRGIGDLSEGMAAKELMARGHTIIERNWKTKFCEIDIVSQLDETIYFTEVKHRKDSSAGDGLAAITPQKLEQMKFAAAAYSHFHKLKGVDLRLMAIATAGSDYLVSQVLVID